MSEHILSLSYGKDSLACLGAIEKLGWPLDRIIHAEIWATDTIPADLPPMVEFKAKADEIIKRRWGISVEHLCAMRGGGPDFYERRFYDTLSSGKFVGTIRGFPMVRGSWCKHLKYGKEIDLRGHLLSSSQVPGGGEDLRFPHAQRSMVQQRSQNALFTGFQSLSTEETGVRVSKQRFSQSPSSQGADINTVVQYVGIALDEPKRLARLDGITKISPLKAIGWTEADCRKWCEENDLLSPIYTTATRGGCWFCHNQGLDQLRQLRHNYPDLWALLMKWDLDSPVSFKPDGKTVHDYDVRFCAEDLGLVPTDRKFRWAMIDKKVVRKCSIFQKQQTILKILEEKQL